MTTLDKIHHIGYFTEDLERAIERYGQAFPLDKVVRGESTVLKAKIAFLYSGGTIIEVMEPEDKSILGGKTGLILHHTAYEVADLPAAMRELAGRGIRFRAGAPNVSPVGQIAYLADDQVGTALHLVQPNQ